MGVAAADHSLLILVEYPDIALRVHSHICGVAERACVRVHVRAVGRPLHDPVQLGVRHVNIVRRVHR